MGQGEPGSLLDLVPGRLRATDGDVLRDGRGEDERLLTEHRDTVADIREGGVTEVHAVHQHPSGGRIVQTRNEADERRLPRAGGTYDRHRLTSGHMQVDVDQYRLVGRVTEAHVLEVEARAVPRWLQSDRSSGVRQLIVALEDLLDALNPDLGEPDTPSERQQAPELGGEYAGIGDEHHQVPDTERIPVDAVTSEDDHEGEPDRADDAPRGVRPCLQRRHPPRRQERLPGEGAERPQVLLLGCVGLDQGQRADDLRDQGDDGHLLPPRQRCPPLQMVAQPPGEDCDHEPHDQDDDGQHAIEPERAPADHGDRDDVQHRGDEQRARRRVDGAHVRGDPAERVARWCAGVKGQREPLQLGEHIEGRPAHHSSPYPLGVEPDGVDEHIVEHGGGEGDERSHEDEGPGIAGYPEALEELGRPTRQRLAAKSIVDQQLERQGLESDERGRDERQQDERDQVDPLGPRVAPKDCETLSSGHPPCPPTVDSTSS